MLVRARSISTVTFLLLLVTFVSATHLNSHFSVTFVSAANLNSHFLTFGARARVRWAKAENTRDGGVREAHKAVRRRHAFILCFQYSAIKYNDQ